jgi:hypothetical protein
MKKLLVGALMSIMALSTFAQTTEREHKSPQEKAALRAEKMKTQLGLTDEQTKKVETAILVKMTKAKEIRTKHAEDKEAIRKEMLPVNEQFKATMKEILTAEQYAQWQEMKKAHRGKGKACNGTCEKHCHKPKKAPSNKKQNLEVE